MFFDLADLRRVAQSQLLGGLPDVFHDAGNRQQRVLSIDDAADAASFRFFELNPLLEDVERDLAHGALL